MPRIALATAIAVTGHDEDMPLLLAACARAGFEAQALAWDDASVGWGRFDLVLLRSTWDYALRRPDFLAWCADVERTTTLLNPLPVVRWNSDKRYLADLAADGLAVIPSTFVEPDAEPLPALQAFLSTVRHDHGFVVKPAVGAGARDAQRHAGHQEVAAASHIARLLDAGRSVLLQPYLATVDELGETALVYIDGAFSHAIRKGPLLTEGGTGEALPAVESIGPRQAAADERSLADAVLTTVRRRFGLDRPLPYARIDLIRDDGHPHLLELELTEPSLFLSRSPGAADRLVAALAARLPADTLIGQ
ncbi:ATP-grasp domain-containing protein [Luteimonas salinilitoris]|uniref:RimK family alpha-L-glutamate ligase n=1 Tax=Luteimonas salinilitoris TaxID=3237697 RepID=A0ABV4HTT2_9GAMM